MSRFRGLLQASLEATKRALRGNLDELMPPTERYIFNFNSKDELKKWHLYSDSQYGGLSSASLEIKDNGNGLSGIFAGNLSLDVTDGTKWNISRSGFCGMRSKRWHLLYTHPSARSEMIDLVALAMTQRKSSFDGFIDLDAYDTIVLKVKGDGRCYISTIYTENWVNSPGQPEDNSWQAFVSIPKGNWYNVKIPISQYLPTWRGNVIEDNLEMNPSRVVGMSLSVNAEGGVPGAVTGPGDFRLDIDSIKALRTQF